MGHEPLIIAAELGTDVLCYGDDPMLLDGPLAWSMFIEQDEARSDGPIVDFDLPVAKWSCDDDGRSHASLLDGEGRVWGWCVSRAYADWRHRHRHSFRKKPPLNEVRGFTNEKSVNIAAGAYKGIDLAFEGRYADVITWYALGDADEIRRLLDRVTSLGKKHNLGWGRVSSWTVVPGPGGVDWTTMRLGSALVRPMPVLWPHAVDADGPALRRSVRAPHWLPSRLTTCVGVSDAG